MNIYIELTDAFNVARLRAVLSSGQAVVFHKLAVMSKDGDWILREDEESLDHVRAELSRRGARYRFGAPLDNRWMRGGWSAHFEFRSGLLRVRTDFVTRPPRLTEAALAAMWETQAHQPFPVVGAADLCELKKTNREKDYAVIGELARILESSRDQLLQSRSAGDLAALAKRYPELTASLIANRPLLAAIPRGREALESELDAERRRLMHANEQRLQNYIEAADLWRSRWPDIAAETDGLSLADAHQRIVSQAEGILPFAPHAGGVP